MATNLWLGWVGLWAGVLLLLSAEPARSTTTLGWKPAGNASDIIVPPVFHFQPVQGTECQPEQGNATAFWLALNLAWSTESVTAMAVLSDPAIPFEGAILKERSSDNKPEEEGRTCEWSAEFPFAGGSVALYPLRQLEVDTYELVGCVGGEDCTSCEDGAGCLSAISRAFGIPGAEVVAVVPLCAPEASGHSMTCP